MRGGLKNKMGTLLLYPDKLVHVGSRAAQMGAGFGAIGMLVAQRRAKSQAAKKVAEGDKSVVAIPLVTLTEIHGSKGKVGGKYLIVKTATGDEYKFGGIKFDQWSDDLSKTLVAGGQTITPTESGFSVT
jgi:hypothetical protein